MDAALRRATVGSSGPGRPGRGVAGAAPASVTGDSWTTRHGWRRSLVPSALTAYVLGCDRRDAHRHAPAGGPPDRRRRRSPLGHDRRAVPRRRGSAVRVSRRDPVADLCRHDGPRRGRGIRPTAARTRPPRGSARTSSSSHRPAPTAGSRRDWARHVGATAAGTDLVLFVDADTVLAPVATRILVEQQQANRRRPPLGPHPVRDADRRRASRGAGRSARAVRPRARSGGPP